MPKPKPQTARRRSASSKGASEERLALAGSMLEWRLLRTQLGSDPEFIKAFDRWHPKNVEAAQRLVRGYAEENPCPLVATVLRLKPAFLNHGLKLVPRDGSPAGAKQLTEWLREPLREGVRVQGATVVDRLAADVATEWLLQDSVAVSWTESSDRPYLLLSEDVRHTAKGGQEKTEWRHGLTGGELDTFVRSFSAGDQPAVRKRYEQDFIRLEDPDWNKRFPAYADYANVVTRGRWGAGLRMPTLRGLVSALDQWRSMELGEASYAFGGRKVFRQFKAGSAPPTSGPNAGAITTRAGKGWSEEAKKAHYGKQGYYEWATDFDRETALHWLDVANFDAAKWDTVLHRLALWAGPLGPLLLGKGQQLGDLWQLFETELLGERKWVGPLLAEVLSEFTPVPVAVEFGSDCFTNPRLRAELFKQAFASGAASNDSLLTRVGCDLEAELAKKRIELAAEQKDPGVLRPIYDAAHGDPGAGGAGGRPTGTPDPGGQ